MIIFGTRGLTSTKDSGQFHCPQCQNPSPFKHKRIRNFFTLYFIPVIPLDVHGEYVECQQCRGTYDMEILNYDPATGQIEFEAAYHQAVKQVMVAMLVADGAVDDAEVETVRKIYGDLTGSELTEQVVRGEIAQAQSNPQDITHSLSQLSGGLNDEGKEMVVKAAFMVAAADGEFQEEEKALLASVGKSLGMSGAHLKGVLDSMVE